MEIVVRNWPDAGLVLKSRSGLRLASPEPTDEERLKLHNAGVMVMLEAEALPPQFAGWRRGESHIILHGYLRWSRHGHVPV